MIFGYIKAKKIISEVRKEIQRRIDNNIENSDWNEGVMFVLDIFESEVKTL